jgi:NDP-sugar pyrophosphorylase family protein
MRAIIMAGGRGERLAPLTTRIPKPVLLLGDTTILEIIIRQLSHAGFQHITLTLAYMGDKVKNYIENHKSLNRLVRVDFVEDKHETGTAGSVSLVPGLDEAFLMMNDGGLPSILQGLSNDRGSA